MNVQANPAPKQTAMKPIRLRTMMSLLLLVTITTPFDFTRSGALIDSPVGFGSALVPCHTEKASLTPCKENTEQPAASPAGTFDRFDPYTLGGKTIGNGVLVL
jgi:hypothetical protein